MKVTYTVWETRQIVKEWKAQGLSIGLVPTMGYLHEGHESLVKRAVSENDRVVVSIFVNPAQFGPSEDLDKYPRNFPHDAEICKAAGASLIFHPEAAEMYPADFHTFVDMNILTETLCGKSRPSHFRGVCTVVNKLFHITAPDRSYFGQKDAQQLIVIQRMVSDLNMDIDIVCCPIIREADGLAKSSRNIYLNPKERKAAVILSHSLSAARSLINQGERNVNAIINAITKSIHSEPLSRIDYADVVDANSLQKVEQIEGSVLVAIAVFIGKTRLIDNFIFELREEI